MWGGQALLVMLFCRWQFTCGGQALLVVPFCGD
jgi:hypothetical protein